jgi:hypothetical protein
MAENRRDVNLVIRAKDEASRAFEQATSVLEQLVGINSRVGSSATDAASDLSKLAAVAVTLDKVYAQVNGSAERAATGMERQQLRSPVRRPSLPPSRRRLRAPAALAKLNGAEAVVAAGRNQAPRIQQIEQVTAEINRLQQSEQKLKSSIALAEATSIRSAPRCSRSARRRSRSRKRSSVSRRRSIRPPRRCASRPMRRRRSKRSTATPAFPAVSPATTPRSSGRFTQRPRRATKRSAKLKAEEAATAELSRAKENQARVNQLLNVNSTGSGKSAQASAAVFRRAPRN